MKMHQNVLFGLVFTMRRKKEVNDGDLNPPPVQSSERNTFDWNPSTFVE